MQIGMVGLGRMGSNMAHRLLNGGHQVVGFDPQAPPVEAHMKNGGTGANSIKDLVNKLAKPRVAWMMVPAGRITEDTVNALAAAMETGDTIIDGGNTHYKDDARRAKAVAAKGIHYVDVGTSGGVWGLERGYCLMIGGPKDVAQKLDPIFKTLAPGRGDIPRTAGREKVGGTAEEGYLYCGPSGAGHFVKMVHNGIEYGMMQAYAEGFDLLHGVNTGEMPEEHRYPFDLPEIAEVWRRGSVIGSWLLDLTAGALLKDPKLEGFTGYVQDSGEGRWTVQAAVDAGVPVSVLTAALYARFRSRGHGGYADKVLSAMRKEFGGHTELKVGK